MYLFVLRSLILILLHASAAGSFSFGVELNNLPSHDTNISLRIKGA